MARKITIEFLGDSKDLQKAMDDAGSRGGKLTSVLGKVGKAAAVGLGVGLAVAAKGLYDAGQAAGDMNETVSKTNAIFGSKEGKALEEWAGNAAKSLGQSKQTALDAASTFGTFGKAAGKSGEDLSKFAMQNTQLATDLASFHNTSPEQAIEAIGAAFRGEAEPMRAYGVLLDDASMRTQALKMGLISTTKEALTPQQKVLAAQALMMKQTSDAQGDFAKTSGGLAGQQKILKAEFENMQVTVGQKVLPIMLGLATLANDSLIPALGRLGSWVTTNVLPSLQQMGEVAQAKILPVLGEIAGVLAGTVLPALVRLTGTLGDNRGALVAVAAGVVAGYVALKVYTAVTKIVAAATVAWTTVQKVLNGTLRANPIGLVVTAVGLLAAGMVLAYQRSETFRNAVDKVASFLRANLVPAVQGAIGILSQIISKMVAVGAAFVNGVQDVARFVTGVKEKISNALQIVGEIPGKALSALGNLGGTLMAAGQNLIQGLIDGITAKLGALKDKLLSVTKLIPDWKGPLDKDKILLTPAGEALMEGLISGIEKKKKKLQSVLEKITDHIKKKQDALATLLDKRQSIVDSFKGMASSVFGASLGTEESPASVDKLVEFQRNQRGRADQLNSSVGTLIGKGLSQDMIKQLIAQGESGIDQINLLATATDAQIADLVANNAATQAALEAAGLKASEALIGDRIAQAERDVVLADAIRDKLKELLEQQDKNTVVQLILDGKVLHASLLKLKREKRGKLELA